MNRELCEFYRDRGYPREWGREFWTNYAPDSSYSHDEWVVVDFEQDDSEDEGVFIAIPDIPGLLAFLREKMPSLGYCAVINQWTESLKNHAWNVRYGMDILVIDPDPTTALALAGKAALEEVE